LQRAAANQQNSVSSSNNNNGNLLRTLNSQIIQQLQQQQKPATSKLNSPSPTNTHSLNSSSSTMQQALNSIYSPALQKTSSVTNNNPAFFAKINDAIYVLVSGSVSATYSGSFKCFKGDNVSFFVSGSTESSKYTLSTLNVITGSNTLIDVQRTRSGVSTAFDFTGPLNASGSLNSIATGSYIVTGSNWPGINPLCCINVTTIFNLITYQYQDCAGNEQGWTGAGQVLCIRYGTIRNAPVTINGSNCGGTC
jgi:hypothetical protein